jgi:hypothetical protein
MPIESLAALRIEQIEIAILERQPHKDQQR